MRALWSGAAEVNMLVIKATRDETFGRQTRVFRSSPTFPVIYSGETVRNQIAHINLDHHLIDTIPQ